MDFYKINYKKGFKKLNVELETLLRARYSIIYIITYEEEQIIKNFRKNPECYRRNILIWSVTNGLRDNEGKKKG